MQDADRLANLGPWTKGMGAAVGSVGAGPAPSPGLRRGDDSRGRGATKTSDKTQEFEGIVRNGKAELLKWHSTRTAARSLQAQGEKIEHFALSC